MPGRVRILYIDDDPGLGRLAHKALSPKGYDIRHVETGEDGLNILSMETFDLVALDHHLKTETGLDVLERIKALPKPPPVIYVTGSEDARIAVAALKAGAVDYVWKDVQGHYRDLLIQAIDQALSQEKLKREKAAAEQFVRDAKERAELLLREVNHRVANSLALVVSLTRLQSNATKNTEVKDALTEVQARITAIAAVHRRLYTSEDVRVVDLDAYIHSLIGDLNASMNAADIKHSLSFTSDENIQLRTDKAISLGIILAELVTNAYKYAYPEDVEGDIRVKLNRVGDDKVRLTVEDDGVGWRGDGPAKGTGLGTRIVTAMARTLDAQTQYDPDCVGTCVTLEFSL